MEPSTIQSYVPATHLQEGKQAPPAELFHEDLGMASLTSDGLTLLCRRGTRLPLGKHRLSPEQLAWLDRHLSTHRRLALLCDGRLLILCNELFSSTSLLCVLLPHAEPQTLAYVLTHLPSCELAISPEARELAAYGGKPEEVYARLSELFLRLEHCLLPSAELDFRLHCAELAALAGCRVQVTDLPPGQLPVSHAELLRWTAFLLCLLLSVRGESAMGPQLLPKEIRTSGLTLSLLHHAERHPQRAAAGEAMPARLGQASAASIPAMAERPTAVIRADGRTRKKRAAHRSYDISRFGFLQLPCFSEFHLEPTETGFELEVFLRNTGRSMQLFAGIGQDTERLRIEFRFIRAG